MRCGIFDLIMNIVSSTKFALPNGGADSSETTVRLDSDHDEPFKNTKSVIEMI